ncbi:hypothetical protein [Microbacterium sp.]|uniref:hypothetical protein n=1 Tax=Microbacterium sp. TaxID=51671 RepID=UPI0028110279|nr:hypothetical protein [Microbacterium sp.]
MRRRVAALWAAFVAAHALTAWLGWVLPSQPMGDVVLVYQPWSASALSDGAVVGVTEPWVYPQLALLPMLAAQGVAAPLTGLLGAEAAYLVAWAMLVTALDLLGFAVLVGRGRSTRRNAAGWFWCAALTLLGPIALYRIDAVTVPLAVAGAVWLGARPRAGAALLAIGAWIKIWPGAVVLAAGVALRQRIAVLLTGAATTAAVIAVLFLLGADRELLGFLGEQTARGLQIESVAATPFLWMAVAGSASIAYSFDILTFQIRAGGADAVAAALTPVMAVAVAGVLVIGVLSARRGAAWQRLLPPLTLALVTALIATNKVGSPQFQTWLFAPVILWLVLDRARAATPAACTLLLCALTFAVYPLTYDGLLRADVLPVVLVTVRNILLVLLFAHSVRAILRVPAHTR